MGLSSAKRILLVALSRLVILVVPYFACCHSVYEYERFPADNEYVIPISKPDDWETDTELGNQGALQAL